MIIVPFLNLFDFAVNFVLQREGGYSNDPDDPGGETKYGISKRYHPQVNIKNLTWDGAIEIYRKEYWLANGCDKLLSDKLAFLHFDTCVNVAAKEALEFLEKSDDNPLRYLLERIFWYNDQAQKHPEKLKYLRGWIERCEFLYKAVV